MALYISDCKNSSRELLQLISTFNEVSEYKINKKKSVALLYAKNNMIEKKERNNTFHNSYKQYKLSWGNYNQASKNSPQQKLQIFK